MATMKSGWLLLAVTCVIAPTSAAWSQTLNPSARDILNTDRPLQPAEVAAVLAGVRAALSGKTFRWSYVPNGPGPEVLMGANGRPRFVRTVSGYDYGSVGEAVDRDGNRAQSRQSGHVDVVTFTEYTGRTARKCDGTLLDGELVIEYEHKNTDDGWTVKARARTLREVGAPVFGILAGNTPVESGNRRSFDDRVGRALVAPWTLPPGAEPSAPPLSGARQSLWIDTVSMLPLRWSIAVPAAPGQGTPAIPDYSLLFTYDSSLDLRPPDIVLSNDCVR
jgi:hypothetical protein